MTIVPEFQTIYALGEVLRRDIYEHLSAWPTERENALRGDQLPAAFRAETEGLRDRAHQWFNLVVLHVLPHTTYDRTHVNLLLRRITAAIGGAQYYEEYPHGVYHLSGIPTAPQIGRTEHRVERVVRINVAIDSVIKFFVLDVLPN